MKKTVKWAIIGCGDISERRVAPALINLPESDLISVSRRRADRTEPFAKRFEVPKG